MKRTVRVYELFGPNKSFYSKYYDGSMVGVAAVSAKQAKYFACNNVWATDMENPRGILWDYNRNTEQWYLLWTGKRTYNGGPRNNARITEIRKWMKETYEEKNHGKLPAGS